MYPRALDRMGVKIPQRDVAILFEGMDRRNTGFVDLSSLVEVVFSKGQKREGSRSARGDRGEDEDDSGSRERNKNRDRDRDRDRDRMEARGERVVLKRNETRVTLRKRPDLLQEILLQLRAVNKERG